METSKKQPSSILETDNEGVPIRKLYVANFPYKCKLADLQNFFAKYGVLEDVSMHKSKNNNSYAFVTFADTASARAVRGENLHIQQRRLTVRPADSWHQPDFRDVHQMGLNEAVQQDFEGSILSLNDDCLLKIFKYLPMTELVQADKVCWRFRSIAEMIYKSHKVFDSDDYDLCSLVCLRSILYNIGPYVQTLKANFRFNSTRNGQLLRFAALYCTNLQILQLCGIEVSYKIKNIQNLFKHLRKLEIEACSVSDHDLSYLLRVSENKTIEEIKLSNNQKLTGKSLVHFRNIKVANLYSCSNIQPVHFIDFIRENPGIEDLNIIMCDRINSECISTVATSLAGLKKLYMSNAYINIYSSDLFQPLVNLKSLTHLTVRYVNFGSVDSLLKEMSETVPLEYLDISSGQLTKQGLLAILNFKTLRVLTMNRKKDCDDDVMRKIAKLKTLEGLSIAACTNVTNDGVEEVVRLNEKINFLDLSACYNMTSELLPSLVEITKNRSHLLTLKVGESCITDEYSELDLNEILVAPNLKIDLSNTMSLFPSSSDETSSYSDETWEMDDDGISDEYDHWSDNSLFDEMPEYFIINALFGDLRDDVDDFDY